ncbi:hypothetical protein RCO27_07690 [Sphingosinicella sp. LHD-64]|uniref:hypothetical protein n=1 Tax=Sphingosinicella sp. LHD-64 TaxID=3072139 RepID=UPI00280F1DAE|nr:hypothetical protein [Sphingosinicella sp. LHD-64]MDQ8756111.1 hypothetical protein [Sphingosinicella sp. LHD-64]
MRLLFALPLLFAAACSVENDRQNGQTTISYDAPGVENVVDDVGRAAEEAASDVGNVADRAGRVVDNVDNGIGDIDVNLNIRRDGEPRNSN